MAKPNGINHATQSSQHVFQNQELAVEIEPTRQKENAPVTREVEFAALPDGRIIDLIRSIRQPSHLEFLVWQGASIRRTSQIEYEDELLVVPKLDPTVASALRLPSMVRACPEIEDLFTEIMNYIE